MNARLAWIPAAALVALAVMNVPAVLSSALPADAAEIDFVAPFRVLGLERTEDMSARTERALSRVLADDGKLKEQVGALASSGGGALTIHGSTRGDEPTISWGEGEPPALTRPGDFSARARTANRDDQRIINVHLRSIQPYEPERTLEANRRIIANYARDDRTMMGAFARDLPRLHALADRLVDFEETRIVEDHGDYAEIALDVQLDDDALGDRYPGVATLLDWFEDMQVRVTNAPEYVGETPKVLMTMQLEGTDRRVHVRAFKRGRELLWSDGEKPLRTPGGDYDALAIDLAGDQHYRVHSSATLSILSFGPFALASFDLPASVWDVRYDGSDGGRRGLWGVRVHELGPPNAFLALFLPLQDAHDLFARTFNFSVGLRPHEVEAAEDAPELHSVTADLHMRFPHIAWVGVMQDLMAWMAESRMVRDTITLMRDA